MAICGQLGIGKQHRGNGACPSRSLLKPCNPISPCMTPGCSEPLSFCLSLGWVPRNMISLCWPFRGYLGLWQTPLSPWWAGSPLLFTAKWYGSSFPLFSPPLLVLQAGELLQLRYPSRPFITACGPAFFSSPPFLPVSTWLLPYVLSGNASVQLVFSYLFRSILL